MASAARLGISPSDLATAISYETGGTFDPWKKGPTTQWGEHRGLIQWGEPQRKKYGVTQDTPVPDQMQAVERYLTDAGVKPGHGLLDVYSAINAGRVGLYNRTDANNGGAPGTVADKVASMAGHRMRANALLGLEGGGGAVPAVQAQASPSAVTSAPLSLAPTGGVGAAAADDGIATALAALAAPQQAEASQFAPVPAMHMAPASLPVNPQLRRVLPSAMARARAMAAAMSRASA